MPSTYDDARRYALAFPGVTEGMSYGTPSLHVGKKLLARLREDGETLVVKVDLSDRARFFAREPDTFFITPHYGDHPVMLVDLHAVHQEVLHDIMAGAWRQVAGKRRLAAYPGLPAR